MSAVLQRRDYVRWPAGGHPRGNVPTAGELRAEAGRGKRGERAQGPLPDERGAQVRRSVEDCHTEGQGGNQDRQ